VLHLHKKKSIFKKKNEGKEECAVFNVGGVFCSKAMAGKFAAHIQKTIF